MPKGKHDQHQRGPAHYRWNPGRMLSSHGYVLIRVGRGHPLANVNGYAYEHLLVWVQAGNPRPGQDEVLHHINEDKTDNRLANLRLMNRGRHVIEEHLGRDSAGRFARLLDGREWNEVPDAR